MSGYWFRYRLRSVDFDLWKNVVHVVISDEARMKAAHDILRLHVEDAARELARMENKQIAEELAKAPEVAASGHWDETSEGLSEHNPFDDLLNVFNALKAEGYEPDYAVMHPKTWGGLHHQHLRPRPGSGRRRHRGPRGRRLHHTGLPLREGGRRSRRDA